jgi:hypothetical protein
LRCGDGLGPANQKKALAAWVDVPSRPAAWQRDLIAKSCRG